MSLYFVMLKSEMGIILSRKSRKLIVIEFGVFIFVLNDTLLTILLWGVRKVNWIGKILPSEQREPVHSLRSRLLI